MQNKVPDTNPLTIELLLVATLVCAEYVLHSVSKS